MTTTDSMATTHPMTEAATTVADVEAADVADTALAVAPS